MNRKLLEKRIIGFYLIIILYIFFSSNVYCSVSLYMNEDKSMYLVTLNDPARILKVNINNDKVQFQELKTYKEALVVQPRGFYDYS